MSFTRNLYDTCSQKEQLEMSLTPGLYKLNTPVQCRPCFQGNPNIFSQRNSANGKSNRFMFGSVDVESDLKGINNVLSKCSKNNFKKCDACNNPAKGTYCDECSADLVSEEDCYFPTEPTRLSNPPCTLRGRGVNRFDPLCLDPQSQLEFPGQSNICSRTVMKDNFRPCIPIPAVNSLNPQADPDNCFVVDNSCYAIYN